MFGTVVGIGCDVRTAGSSAKVAVVVDLIEGKSFVYNKYNTDPSKVPSELQILWFADQCSPWCFTKK